MTSGKKTKRLDSIKKAHGQKNPFTTRMEDYLEVISELVEIKGHASPMSREKKVIGKLAAMGMIAGAPAIFGAWVGGFVYSPFTSVIFFSIGAGAIFQVIVTILKWLREDGDKNLSSAAVASGFAIGMVVMYVTGIFV